MSEYKGTLEKVDVGAGGWKLKTSEGKSFDLHGPVPDHLVGKEVVVKGEKAGSFGFIMSGDPAIEVHSIRKK